MTVIAYRNCKDIDIQFEDGTVITNKNYNNFKQHSIKHPTLFATHRNNNIIKGTLCNIKITGLTYQTPDEINYFCECPVCGHKDIWNVAEIKEHNETCHTDQRKEITA